MVTSCIRAQNAHCVGFSCFGGNVAILCLSTALVKLASLRTCIGPASLPDVSFAQTMTPRLVRILLCAFLAFTTLGVSAQVVINELVPANDSTLRDENGDFSDWFELY